MFAKQWIRKKNINNNWNVGIIVLMYYDFMS